jgi:hypothetical protein
VITRCARCGERIRDCTGFEQRGFIQVPVPDWYHTQTGWRMCADGLTRAWPVVHVHVACATHYRKPEDDCRACDVSLQVSLGFHNEGRCIEALCGWLHA